jgi:hypothetical protein
MPIHGIPTADEMEAEAGRLALAYLKPQNSDFYSSPAVFASAYLDAKEKIREFLKANR